MLPLHTPYWAEPSTVHFWPPRFATFCLLAVFVVFVVLMMGVVFEVFSSLV